MYVSRMIAALALMATCWCPRFRMLRSLASITCPSTTGHLARRNQLLLIDRLLGDAGVALWKAARRAWPTAWRSLTPLCGCVARSIEVWILARPTQPDLRPNQCPGTANQLPTAK